MNWATALLAVPWLHLERCTARSQATHRCCTHGCGPSTTDTIRAILELVASVTTGQTMPFDRFSTDPQAHRELMVYFWYPTSQKAAAIKGTYLPGAKEMDATPDIQHRVQQEFEANWPSLFQARSRLMSGTALL